MSGAGAYLFLQGPSSPLYGQIAEHLTGAGHECYRINLNFGDQLFWRRSGATNYRGRFQGWGAYIRRFYDDHAIRTVILHGEERPYHKEAALAARERGITVVVIEMGYLRPDWVTVERDGLSSNSHFPRDPKVILRAAGDLPLPDMTRKYGHTFLAEALYDLAYYLPAAFFCFLFPHYRFHGIYHPFQEYAGWLGRLATKTRRERAASLSQQVLLSSEGSYFIYPLQLETDYQLRAHSPFGSQREALGLVIGSFAAHADPVAKLVVKVHPLDNGLIAWQKVIEAKVAECGVGDRVTYLDGGDLGVVLPRASGVVTVNSTAALAGLQLGLKTKVLGSAIYDIDGLTHRGSLDEFWRSEVRPDPVLRDAFFRLVASSIQERGNFYGSEGVVAAAKGVARRLLSGRLNYNIPPASHLPFIKSDLPDNTSGRPE